VLGLASTDVNRPITRLKLKVDLDNLEQMMLDVMSEVRPKQYRVRDGEGHVSDLRLTPYRTADNRIDGVVLNFVGANYFEDGDQLVPPARRGTQVVRKAAKKPRKKAKGKK
jgi:two-component system CheB/CheR fusion protein